MTAKSKQQRVFLDLDEVVADMLTGFAALCNERLGTNVTRESFTSWELSKPLDVPPEIVYTLLSTPGLFAKLEPMPGAVEGVRKLMKDERFDVLFLSASNSLYSCSEKRNWIRKYFGNKGSEQLILATRKDVVGRPGDWLVDDRPKNVQEWIGRSMLFDCLHNKDFDHPLRVKTWDEIHFNLEKDLLTPIEEKHES